MARTITPHKRTHCDIQATHRRRRRYLRVPHRLLRAAHLARLLWYGLRRPVTLGCRAIVVDADHAVLLVRHSYVPGWHLPGGGIGRGETLAQATSRELREETGLETAGPLRLHGLFLRQAHGNSDHVAVHVVEQWHGEIRTDGLEISEARFFPSTALPDATTPATRRRIEEWLGRRPLAERW